MSDKKLATNENSPSAAENPFTAPVEGLQESVESATPTITKRFTILGVVIGIGYTVVLLIYGVRLHWGGGKGMLPDTRGPDLVEVVVQALVVGVVSTVVLAIVGAGVGTFIEIVASIVRGTRESK
jgi:hypothetical protein